MASGNGGNRRQSRPARAAAISGAATSPRRPRLLRPSTPSAACWLGLWLAAALLLVGVSTGVTLAAYYSTRPWRATITPTATVAYISAVAGPDDAIILARARPARGF